MTRTIIFATGFAFAGALAASTAAFAQNTGPNMLNEVEVKAELGDIDDANALNYWPNIEEDLAKVILAHAGSMVSDDGYDIVVSLREVSLSGSKLLTGEGEFNKLEGYAYFIPGGETVAQEQDVISVEAVTAPVPADAIAVIVPNKPVYYAALLEGFADKAISTLSELESTPAGANLENREQQN